MTFDTTPVPVPVGDCRCPGSPHEDGDVVFLAPYLSLAGGMAARQAMVSVFIGETDSVQLQEALAGIWLRHGIVSWSFVDDDGDPIAVSPTEGARLLPYGKGGRLVAEKADDLYAEDVTDPLGKDVEATLNALTKANRQARRAPSPRSKAGSTRRRKASSPTPISTSSRPR